MPAAQMVMGLRSEKCAKDAHFHLCNSLTINEKKVKRLKTDNTDNLAHLQSSVFKLSKDLIDSIHEEGIVAYTS